MHCLRKGEVENSGILERVVQASVVKVRGCHTKDLKKKLNILGQAATEQEVRGKN